MWNRQKNVSFFDRRKNQYSDHSHDDDNKYSPWDQHRNNNIFERRRPYYNDYHRDDEEEKEPEWMKGINFVLIFLNLRIREIRITSILITMVKSGFIQLRIVLKVS